jgi:hypothetical protein
MGLIHTSNLGGKVKPDSTEHGNNNYKTNKKYGAFHGGGGGIIMILLNIMKNVLFVNLKRGLL